MSLDGIVTHLFLKPAQERGLPMLPVAQVFAIKGEGLQDDASFGRRKRQVLLIENGILDDFKLVPGDVRENIVVSGMRLAGTEPGVRFNIGEANLEVTMDCAPCDFLDSVRPGLKMEMHGRRGTLCRVVDTGLIRVGDKITLNRQM